mgnify:CR=1 FL=1
MSLIAQVKQEIDTVLDLVDETQLDAVAPLLTKEKRIFVLGAGRSGLMARAFAMRLMHWQKKPSKTVLKSSPLPATPTQN